MTEALTKRGRGRPAWEPTDEERRLVTHYTSIGYDQEQIARLMKVCVDTLAKHCRDELDNGALQVNAKIAGKLYSMAMSGNVPALIFWAKTRLRWKETSGVEHSGPDGAAIPLGIDPSTLNEEQLRALASIPLQHG